MPHEAAGRSQHECNPTASQTEHAVVRTAHGFLESWRAVHIRAEGDGIDGRCDQRSKRGAYTCVMLVQLLVNYLHATIMLEV